jgi:hypothetical protein
VQGLSIINRKFKRNCRLSTTAARGEAAVGANGKGNGGIHKGSEERRVVTCEANGVGGHVQHLRREKEKK